MTDGRRSKVERTLIVVLGTALVFTAVLEVRTARAPGDEERTDWAQLGRLPDWGGLWVPDPHDKAHPFGTGDPPWNAEAKRQIDFLKTEEKAGRPRNVYINCLPEGMPSFDIMTLNAFEFLFTHGNRLRRIYTDGRPHPADPDPTFNGHSIGHWESDTLVVDTVGILPQAFLPIGQAAALPNNGDLHIVERIRPTGRDALTFDLEITAPRRLTAPWHISRHFVRRPDRKAEIVEASCRQGDFASGQDAQGNYVFIPIAHEEGGAPLPGQR